VTVELPGGVKAWHYPVPPEDFDPLEADEATLTRYGFRTGQGTSSYFAYGRGCSATLSKSWSHGTT
jgi:hypothetical protein